MAGVVYIHNISQDQFILTAQRNLDIFLGFCVDNSPSKTIIVTSQWDRSGPNTNFESREQDLREVRWAKLLSPGNGGPGAAILRLGSPESARSAINYVLTRLGKKKGVVERSVDLDDRLEPSSRPARAHPSSGLLQKPVDSTPSAQPESLDPLPKVDIVIL